MIHYFLKVFDTVSSKGLKMCEEDGFYDIVMKLRQIDSLIDVMLLGADIEDTPNLITLKELTESCLDKIKIF